MRFRVTFFISAYALLLSSIFLISCTKVIPVWEECNFFEQRVSIGLPNEKRIDKEAVDLGVILLPKRYSSDGNPVPLVIYCHSGGGSVTYQWSEVFNEKIVKYLLYKGYAVLSVAGMPESYSANLKIDHERTVGSHIAHRAYTQAYYYVMERYNLRKDGCFILANSNGGLSMMNMHNLTNIPILAMSGFSPLLSIEQNAWYVRSASFREDGFKLYQNRANIIRIFGMKVVNTQEELNRANYEAEKVGEYDPYEYCVKTKAFKMRAPLLIFNPKNEQTVKREYAEHLMKLLNSRGIHAITISDIEEYGGHDIQPNSVYVESIVHNGETLQINLSIKLIYDFFEKYRVK